jgi:hypothetical protein
MSRIHNTTMNYLLNNLCVMTAGLVLAGAASAQECNDREMPGWEFSSDFRLRAEITDYDTDTDDRFRGRLRFRVGANYQLADNIKFGARLVSGDSTNANSTHVDLGGDTGGTSDFSSFEMSLDRLFLTYEPTWFQGATMTFGKFGHGFAKNPVYGELVWDGDVQPEGFAMTWSHDYFGLFDTNKFNVGLYVMDEVNRGRDETIQVAQFAGTKEMGEDTFGLSFGMYNFSNNVDVANHYRILNPILTFETGDFTFAAEFIENYSDNDGVDDSGQAFGLSMKLEDGAKVYIQRQEIEADAVFSQYAQDDWATGNTNFTGFVAGWKKSIAKNVGLHIWAMQETENDTELNDTYRFRVDFNINF